MLNSLVMVLAAVAVVTWLSYMVVGSVRGKGKEKVPANLRPGMPNDELEGPRLDKALAWSVIFAAFLAISMPVYFLGETDRQAGFAHDFEAESLARGTAAAATTADGGLDCAGCHGPGLSGGVASFVEGRSNVAVSWLAPRLDTIMYRYSRDEVKFWIEYGRPGTPMPAWGLAGGGPLNDQEVEDLLNYIESVQLTQAEALNLIEGDVAVAQARLEGSGDAAAALLASQQTLVAFANDAGRFAPALSVIGEKIVALSEDDGVDVDRDGLSDNAENLLPGLFAEVAALGLKEYEVLGVTPVLIPDLDLDPRNPRTNGVTDDGDVFHGYTDEGGHVVEGDFSRIIKTIQLFEVAAETKARTLERFQGGLDYLTDAISGALWEVDIDAVADASFSGDRASAQRAINLFNANCSRCHTTGYSAGAAFQGPIGAGGFGPSLLPPRATVQFGDAVSLAGFIASGSVSGQPYGVNGIGRGYMPGFGGLLSQADLDLLATYLLGDTLGGPALGGGN